MTSPRGRAPALLLNIPTSAGLERETDVGKEISPTCVRDVEVPSANPLFHILLTFQNYTHVFLSTQRVGPVDLFQQLLLLCMYE